MLAAERVKVFWQPGCTSCLRTKEFLTKSGVEYESINVHGNPAGMEELRKLGARSVPVVAHGDRFVFAQAIGDVIKFLDLKVQIQERLSPDELVKKLELVLPAACRYIRQIPAEWLDSIKRGLNPFPLSSIRSLRLSRSPWISTSTWSVPAWRATFVRASWMIRNAVISTAAGKRAGSTLCRSVTFTWVLAV